MFTFGLRAPGTGGGGGDTVYLTGCEDLDVAVPTADMTLEVSEYELDIEVDTADMDLVVSTQDLDFESGDDVVDIDCGC